MQRFSYLRLLAALLLGLAPGSATSAQPAPTPAPLAVPPGPVSHFPTRFDVIDPPEQFDWVVMVIDFPDGAWTPSHAPGGSLYVTVIEGEISTRMSGTPGDTYPPGSTFTANQGEYLEVGNMSAGTARIIATVLLPNGAPLMAVDEAGSTTDADAPRPTTVYQSSIAVEPPRGPFELVHLLLDLDPGTWTPRHMHGGREHVLVTAGEMTLQRHGNVEVFAAGESWTNTGGVVHAAGNDGGSFAQSVVAFLLPAGSSLTTVV